MLGINVGSSATKFDENYAIVAHMLNHSNVPHLTSNTVDKRITVSVGCEDEMTMAELQRVLQYVKRHNSVAIHQKQLKRSKNIVYEILFGQQEQK